MNYKNLYPTNEMIISKIDELLRFSSPIKSEDRSFILKVIKCLLDNFNKDRR